MYVVFVNNIEASRRYAWPDTELSSFFGWLDTCSSFAVGRLGRVAKSVSRIFRERRPVIEFVPCVDLPRAGSPGMKPFDPEEFVERLAWRTIEGSRDGTGQFDPVLLHETFVQAIK
uniref:Uncharacterized protein n=1 Tax=Timema douglasi TaxID=61478 RepID=A0A7R8VYA0_TIMDO|nr:unnamed protein product [Timema douglasi]